MGRLAETSEEEWITIDLYPRYEAGSLGHIRSKRREVPLRPNDNGNGQLKVNLSTDEGIKTRSVSRLVAQAFLEPPPRADYNSVLHYDGSLHNCAADNLDWRPRYFVLAYHRQFTKRTLVTKPHPIVNTNTGERFANLKEVVVRYGLLQADIVRSIHSHVPTWPGFYLFDYE